MKFCVIASGSSGNMTYVETESSRILIDTGISLLKAKRLTTIDFKTITDIFITHSHLDHIKFITTFINFTDATLYLSKECFKELETNKNIDHTKLLNKKIAFIESDSLYKIKDISLYTLKMNHDALNTLGFIITSNSSSLGYFTDTGIFPKRYIPLLKTLDGLIIEANHNISAQINSNRPNYLIARNLSSKGHLSNESCLEVLNEIINPKTKVIILAHVSLECNSLDYIQKDILEKLSNYNNIIEISYHDCSTKMYEV